MDRVLDRISETSAFLSGMVIVVMMVMITIDAVGRKFGFPVPGGLEFSEAMMVAIVYLSLMAVQHHRENVFVSIGTHKLSRRANALLDTTTSLLALALFAVFTWIAMQKALDAYSMREYRVAAIKVPIWPFRFVIPFGLALLCVQMVVTVVQDWRSFRGGGDGEREPAAPVGGGS
jgi:TRAP-type C4-dicarboxylate transport system permease small subunit